MNSARSLRLASLALTAATFAAGLVAMPTTASADRVRVRVGGDVRIRAHGSIRIGGPRYRYRGHYRPYYRPRVHLRYYARPYFFPRYYWGFRYAYPPPACEYECGPSYYAAPPPVAVAVETAPAEPPLSRLGLGIFGGSVDVENNDAGSDLGLIGRLRLTRHLILEAEVSKTEIADGARVDKRLGGALLFEFAPYSALSPYVLGGGGFGQTEVDDGRFTAEQAYGEVGIGLEWAITRHIALFGDLRAGVRESNASDEEILLVTGGGGGSGATVDDDERFTRARIGALLHF